ncbi:radical SAM protein [Pseudoalteromonas sp. OOF1S-7]|uniref:radical SAM protein n=1 Tax=Pseudoalteromonas sp. OOF1S-7 TaxID=2917757 RepID=UPI001EF6D650|nr:radical SAM protein [Pseudoalteromonas sp. OOF1S-7]MCG7536143.1 radical SAM protein [Pseudoalteromonas sp. OOF1S-7]
MKDDEQHWASQAHISEHQTAYQALKRASLANQAVSISVREHALYRSNKYLYLTILLTEQCNFRCTYCYQTFRDTKLLPAIEAALKAFIHTEYLQGLKHLEICWFGGEPTLHTEPVLRLGHWIRAHCPQLVYHASMSTNGYLLNARLFGSLLAAGVRHYQISLDGDEQTHNTTRKRRTGAGSFVRIWQNLTAIKRLPGQFGIDLRLHHHKLNAQDFEQFSALVEQEFGSDSRFNLVVEAIKNLGGANHKQAQALNVMHDTSGRRGNNICYAAMPRHLLIYPDGRLGKCTVKLDTPENLIGQLHEDGSITLDKARFRSWTRGFSTLDAVELSCPANQLKRVSRHPDSVKPGGNSIPVVNVVG